MDVKWFREEMRQKALSLIIREVKAACEKNDQFKTVF